MKTIVLSLGGSLIAPGELDIEFLASFRNLILDYAQAGNRAIIVTGGGQTSRRYQQACEKIVKTSKENLDWIGIAATKINGHLVRSIFGDLAYSEVLDDPSKHIKTDKPIIIGSGFVPGSSSDKDAVILAETYGADKVINLTNVNFVYDKNPKKFADAKPFEKMSWDEFTDLFGTEWQPGLHSPFDPIAAVEAKKSGISVLIMDGSNLENLSAALNDKPFKGTVLTQ